MIALHRAEDRSNLSHRKHDVWLTFLAPDRLGARGDGIGELQVLYENRIPPRGGMVTSQSPRQETEIVTYVREGTLSQKDSTGWLGVIHVSEFQSMTLGRRVRLSERNSSYVDGTHIFRVSLSPSTEERDQTGEQRFFSVAERRGLLCVIASPDGRKGSLHLHQDAVIYSGILSVGQHVVHELAPQRIGWLHVVRGEVTTRGLVLSIGDTVGFVGESAVSFTTSMLTEVLLVDLAPVDAIVPPGSLIKVEMPTRKARKLDPSTLLTAVYH